MAAPGMAGEVMAVPQGREAGVCGGVGVGGGREEVGEAGAALGSGSEGCPSRCWSWGSPACSYRSCGAAELRHSVQALVPLPAQR